MIRHQTSLIETSELIERFRKLEELPRELLLARPTEKTVLKLHHKLLGLMCGEVNSKGSYIQRCRKYYTDHQLISFYLDPILRINHYIDYDIDIRAAYHNIYYNASQPFGSHVISEDLLFTVHLLRLFSLSVRMVSESKYEIMDDYENVLYMLHYLPLLYNFLFNFSGKLSIIE